MWIIFLSGKMGTGKDTLANILQNKHGFKVYHFSDKLKDILRQAGWDGEKDEKGRRLLQDVGNALRRYNPDTWVNITFNKMLTDVGEEHYDRICIADWRYKNEYYVFKDKCSQLWPNTKYLTVRIIRNSCYASEYNQALLEDISETDLDDFDFDMIIYNTDSIKQLEKEACNIIEKLSN